MIRTSRFEFGNGVGFWNAGFQFVYIAVAETPIDLPFEKRELILHGASVANTRTYLYVRQ